MAIRKTAAPGKAKGGVSEKPAGSGAASKIASKTAGKGGGRKPAAAVPKPKPRSGGGAGEIAIRMYRGLLGDFFFLRHIVGGKQFKMLIDCGVLQSIGRPEDKPATVHGKDQIRAGVANLIEEFGPTLDLVVVTHEHYDHLSGYILANDQFQSLEISKLWVAWTEDRTDAMANGYREKKKRAVAALAALAANPALAETPEMSTVRDLLQFHGPLAAEGGALGMAADADGKLRGNASCEAIINWLKQRAGEKNTSYLNPGEAHPWGVDNALRAYVLGPPRDDKKLRDLDPSPGADREVYLTRGEDVEAIRSLAVARAGLVDTSQSDVPFALPHRRKFVLQENARWDALPETLEDEVVRRYCELPPTARIDQEWLGSAEALALKIDGDVNNTSLVLALELPGKEILLFAADAQVGNWLSWGDQQYPADDSKSPPMLSVDRLLARTILYKVGHHASHNATLRERGLELMTDPRLCAVIPVVKTVAAEQKTSRTPQGWQMPYEDLYKRLQQRADKRIIMGDGDPAEEKKAFEGAIFELHHGPDAQDPLWAELRLAL